LGTGTVLRLLLPKLFASTQSSTKLLVVAREPATSSVGEPRPTVAALCIRAAVPACRAVRSRKFRVGSGILRTWFPVMTSPVVAVRVSTVSNTPLTSVTVLTWPSCSRALALVTFVISTFTLSSTVDSKPGASTWIR